MIAVNTLKPEPLWTVRLILDGFSRSVRMLSGELRADLAEDVCTSDTHPDLLAMHLAETIWQETVRAYLESPVKSFAVSGYPDINPGYTHLLSALETVAIPCHHEPIRLIAARISNEICRAVGRLLLVTSAGKGPGLETSLRVAEAHYRLAFRLTPLAAGGDEVSQREGLACTS